MKKAILTSVMALTACATPAFAADVAGTLDLGGRFTDINGSKAKFNEYRDQRSAVTLGFDLGLSQKDYYLELNGKNSGFVAEKGAEARELQDQTYQLQGGKYESFKYSLFYDETPNNMTYGAQTLYQGNGTSTLAAPVSSTATAAQMTAAPKYSVDYGIVRRNYGAGLEVSLKTPFFLSAKAERNETNGNLPLGTYYGQIKEIPMPVSYQTDNLYLETGYRTKGLIFTVDGTISTFHEQNSPFSLAFSNAFSASSPAMAITLPPSNEYYKVGGSLKYDLPFIKSTLMARGSYSKTTNDILLNDASANNVNGAGYGTLFHGNLNYTTASASLASNPIQNLETRVFVNYLNKINDSNTGFDYRTTNSATALAAGETEGFDYHKINGGFDLSYKLPAKTKISAGYEYLNLVRAIRQDATQTVDHIAYVQAKNNLLDWVTAKLRLQFLNRESDFRSEIDPAVAGQGYFRPYDAATKNQDSIKVGLDLEPAHNLSFGLEYAYKHDKYTGSILGVQNETRHDFHVDANLTAGVFKFNPYFDFELAEQQSRHRVFSTFNPPENYFWTNNATNVYYAIGMNSEVEIIKDRLTANIAARYEDSSGDERFTLDNITAQSTPIFNNNSLDNYIRKSLSARLNAKLTRQLKATVGYSIEKLQYLDDHYTGYTNYPLAGYALTGAYNAPDYTAQVGFVTLSYAF